MNIHVSLNKRESIISGISDSSLRHPLPRCSCTCSFAESPEMPGATREQILVQERRLCGTHFPGITDQCAVIAMMFRLPPCLCENHSCSACLCSGLWNSTLRFHQTRCLLAGLAISEGCRCTAALPSRRPIHSPNSIHHGIGNACSGDGGFFPRSPKEGPKACLPMSSRAAHSVLTSANSGAGSPPPVFRYFGFLFQDLH